MSDSLQAHGLYSSWNSPGQNTGMGSLSLLQGIFPTQGSNPDLPHCRQILYLLRQKGSPRILEWVASRFSRGSSWHRSWTRVSILQADSLPTELSGKPLIMSIHISIIYLHSFFFFHILFFYLFFLLEANYFTILYWFCHTSTWICHRCTHVPHPEPPSHLPPHTIPLGHPSAPAPSILYPASNLDWPFISYMVLYMFQFHSSKSSPPSLSHRVQKTVLYICVCFAVSRTGLSLPSLSDAIYN